MAQWSYRTFLTRLQNPETLHCIVPYRSDSRSCWTGTRTRICTDLQLRLLCWVSFNCSESQGMQYAAEVGASNSRRHIERLGYARRPTSVLLVYAMEAINNVTGTFTVSLIIVAVLLGGSAILATSLKENDQR